MREIALLFDDGPHPENSRRLLELFAREGVVANFAQIGNCMESFPDLSQAAVEAGHCILNHSLTHGRIAEMDDPTLDLEVSGPIEIFQSVIGTSPRLYWPPYGDRDERLEKAIEAHGMQRLRVENWHYVPSDDWDVNHTSRALIEENIVRGMDALQTEPEGRRGLLLFHEWRDETIDVMPDILARLKRAGVRFIRVDAAGS